MDGWMDGLFWSSWYPYDKVTIVDKFVVYNVLIEHAFTWIADATLDMLRACRFTLIETKT